MKKAAAVFLLSIFLFNTAGYYFLFKAEQFQIKSDIKTEIRFGSNSSELENLTIEKKNLSEIEWLEEGKEMRYHDQLYDIASCKENPESITFYCINDTKEKSLLSKLEDHINTHVLGSNPAKKDSSKKLLDTVVKLFFSHQISFSAFQSSSNITYFTSNLIYTPALLEINSPPPEFA